MFPFPLPFSRRCPSPLSSSALMIFFALAPLHCNFPGSPSSSSPSISQHELEVIAEGFALAALSPGKGMNTPPSRSPLYPQSSPLFPLASCSPQELLPPTACPGGGNIYYTINLSCNGPSGCCGAQNPCSQDEISISGMGTVTYNNCTTTTTGGDRLLIQGSLHSTLTSTAQFTCTGIVTIQVKVTLTGMPSIRVNGREVCNGDIFLTATATYSGTISVNVSGTVCGERLYRTISYGCVVSCGNNRCCPSGSYCGTCSPGACLPLSYPVDCCNGRACPAQTQCTEVNGETRCRYP